MKITLELTVEEAQSIVDVLDDAVDSAIDTKQDLINDVRSKREFDDGEDDEDLEYDEDIAEQEGFINEIRGLQFRIQDLIKKAE